MASAAEHLASSITLANFSKATELKKRLWFTVGALILFRLLSFVPVPGIDPVAMTALYKTQRATLVGLGLNKLHRTVEVEGTPEVLGQVNKVHHLLKVEEAA